MVSAELEDPAPPWFCLTQTWIKQNQKKNVKHATNWATRTLAEKFPKLENSSIIVQISLQKAINSNFLPISAYQCQGGPMASWFIWKNATFTLKHFSAQIS